MKEVWELCRRLNNPTRLKLLMMDVYSQKLDDGLNVGIAMDDNSLKQPATSSHLSALASLGIIRRCRSGRFMNYYPEISDESPRVAEIARLIRERGRTNSDNLAFSDVFSVMMNAFRAKAVANIALTDRITLLELAEKYDKEMRLVTRDLKPAESSSSPSDQTQSTYCNMWIEKATHDLPLPPNKGQPIPNPNIAICGLDRGWRLFDCLSV